MTGRMMGRLTYANVMATIAVFIALGGGAYALGRGQVQSRNIARDAVKARHIAFGVRSIPMLATFNNLEAGAGGAAQSPVGISLPGQASHKVIAPQTFIATGLRVKLDSPPLPSGRRTFTLRVNDFDTALTCQIDAGNGSCRSNARVRVPQGKEVYFETSFSGTSSQNAAFVGWRAILP